MALGPRPGACQPDVNGKKRPSYLLDRGCLFFGDLNPPAFESVPLHSPSGSTHPSPTFF